MHAYGQQSGLEIIPPMGLGSEPVLLEIPTDGENLPGTGRRSKAGRLPVYREPFFFSPTIRVFPTEGQYIIRMQDPALPGSAEVYIMIPRSIFCFLCVLLVFFTVTIPACADVGVGIWGDESYQNYEGDPYSYAKIISPSPFISNGNDIPGWPDEDPYNSALVISPSPFIGNDDFSSSMTEPFWGYGRGNAFTLFPSAWNPSDPVNSGFPSMQWPDMEDTFLPAPSFTPGLPGSSFPVVLPQNLSEWPASMYSTSDSPYFNTVILPGGEVISPGSGGFWVSPDSPSFNALNAFKDSTYLVKIYVQPLF